MTSRSGVIIDSDSFFFRCCTGCFCGSDCGDNTRDWYPSDDEKTAEGEMVGGQGRLFAEYSCNLTF